MKDNGYKTLFTLYHNVKYFVTFVAINLLFACSQNHEVTTWNEWCDYQVRPEIIGMEAKLYSYNFPKIRQDFVRDYNEILVEELVSNHFLGFNCS